MLSKRPALFAPDIWPTYFIKAKDICVWDKDNIKYYDFSLMGIGTNILGYCNYKIDKPVINAIKKSNMSTLNCYEEVNLAEILLKLHSWSGMCKFTRTGGEANTVALRIARCNTNKTNVAICGYHGWHDWYLSSNLQKKNNLEKHLLRDLETKGINIKLKDTCYPFEYNNFNQLKKIVRKKNIGVIFMEVSRNYKPKDNFLKKVRKLADDHKIILIFDECTSGFRETFGGLHLKYKVNPDICVLGKSLGNGYPINAVIGKTEIMKKSSDSFMSSTFWSDRIGPVAAISTLKEMKKIKSWEYISKQGKYVKEKWKLLAKKHKIKINILGLDSMPVFNFIHKNNLAYKTFLTQEMLKRRILATNAIYISTKHNKKNLNKYFKILDLIFLKIKKLQKLKLSNEEFLETRISQENFKRLN